MRRARACGADAIGMHFKLAKLGALARTHRAGLDAYVWTVNDDELIEHFLADPRVNALITDRPGRALELRDLTIARADRTRPRPAT